MWHMPGDKNQVIKEQTVSPKNTYAVFTNEEFVSRHKICAKIFLQLHISVGGNL